LLGFCAQCRRADIKSARNRPRLARKHTALQTKMASEVAVMSSDAPPAVPIQSECLE
jgi:hypothetical protein